VDRRGVTGREGSKTIEVVCRTYTVQLESGFVEFVECNLMQFDGDG
jgi:hypothetical protein